jgi:hypothetical protein
LAATSSDFFAEHRIEIVDAALEIAATIHQYPSKPASQLLRFACFRVQVNSDVIE